MALLKRTYGPYGVTQVNPRQDWHDPCYHGSTSVEHMRVDRLRNLNLVQGCTTLAYTAVEKVPSTVSFTKGGGNAQSNRRKRHRVSQFDPKAFGRRLRAAREELELTQTEMEQRSHAPGIPGSGISVPYISKLERFEQDSRPSDDRLQAIARALGHRDAWTVREWAGIERSPGTSVIETIRHDEALSPPDRTLMIKIYERLLAQP